LRRPRVSVLIPAHNAESFLGETLESVFRQTYADLEVILVDDGSSDRTVPEAQRFYRQGLRLIRQSRRGAASARNLAYRASGGEFIQFLDADDLLDPQKIELQLGRLREYPTAVASAEWGRFYGDPSTTDFRPDATWADLCSLEWLARSRADGRGMLFPAMWLLPRAIAHAAGPWNEELTVGDDGEYFTRVILTAQRVLFCPGARCRYRSGINGSLSGRKSPAAWASQYLVNELCERHLLGRENSDRMRRALALSWQHLAHEVYPYDRELASRALTHAGSLHPIRIAPTGGRVFSLASRVVGWRCARRLQVLSGRP
jgi:glycosyltransferase involved in cell wall biosynthesis